MAMTIFLAHLSYGNIKLGIRYTSFKAFSQLDDVGWQYQPMFIIHRKQTKTDVTRLSTVTANGTVPAGTKASLNLQSDVTHNGFLLCIFIMHFIPASSRRISR
jgi:hypothetical protein